MIAISVARFDFLKIWKMDFCCTILDNFHAQNGKDPAHRFRTAHTFPYLSYKLLIIIAITAAILNILKILNIGFCRTIIGKFHTENEKDPPHRFRPVHKFLYFSCKLYNDRHNGHVWFFCCTIIGKIHVENEKICLIDSDLRIIFCILAANYQ